VVTHEPTNEKALDDMALRRTHTAASPTSVGTLGPAVHRPSNRARRAVVFVSVKNAFHEALEHCPRLLSQRADEGLHSFCDIAGSLEHLIENAIARSAEVYVANYGRHGSILSGGVMVSCSSGKRVEARRRILLGIQR